jgi:hypothetical protein
MEVQHLGQGHVGPATTFASLPTPVLGAVADKLGISVDALRAQLAAGKPLGTIARVAGLARDELVAAVDRAQHPPALPEPSRQAGASLEVLL